MRLPASRPNSLSVNSPFGIGLERLVPTYLRGVLAVYGLLRVHSQEALRIGL